MSPAISYEEPKALKVVGHQRAVRVRTAYRQQRKDKARWSFTTSSSRRRFTRSSLKILLVAVSIIMVVGAVAVGYAVECGDTLVGSVTLGADLSCATGHGLILSEGANLDCNGHSITGAEQVERYGVYVRDAGNVIVRNCAVNNFEIGIRLRGAANTIVRRNLTQHNTRYGIELTQGSTGALIEANDLLNNGDEGIHVSGPWDRDAGHQILGNMVVGNVAEGIYLLGSDGNTVAENKVRHNGKGGIYGRESERNIIEGNTLANDPIQLMFGSHRNVVRGNAITGAEASININGEQNTIAENLVSGSDTEGILAEGPDNAFSCNRVVDNPVGFRFKAGAAPNTVNENVIMGNSIGLDATGLAPADPAIEANENWWGCVGGPGFPGCDPVAGKVDTSSPASEAPACVRCIAGTDCYGRDDYKCWKVRDLKNPKFEVIRDPGISLDDQFGLDPNVAVRKPFLVCNPADKNGSGVDDPKVHQCCYRIKGRRLSWLRPRVEVSDQFGTLQLMAKKPELLCQPCSATELSPSGAFLSITSGLLE